MADVDLRLRINLGERMSFTAGEDRGFGLLLVDQATGLPYDLTNATLTMALPRLTGGTIKRRSGPFTVDLAVSSILNGLSTIRYPGHGLVSGDAVTVAGANGALPAPLVPNITYHVSTNSVDSFGLVDSNGNPVAFTSSSTAPAAIQMQGFIVTQPILGSAALMLPMLVSNAVATGQGQSYQLTVLAADGLTRILTGTNQLDVFAQTLP